MSATKWIVLVAVAASLLAVAPHASATTCATNADCDGGPCLNGECCVGMCSAGGAVCVDDHTVSDATGTRKECAPYTCSAGFCKAACASNSDCVAPVTCNPSGQCALAPNPAHATGCNSSVSGADAASGAVASGALALLGAWLVRRGRARTARRR